jgi:hypothetical protein
MWFSSADTPAARLNASKANNETNAVEDVLVMIPPSFISW